MSIKKIKEHNSQLFIDDLKRVRTVLVLASNTGNLFETTKKEVKNNAESTQICYVLKDDIYINRRLVMLIL